MGHCRRDVSPWSPGPFALNLWQEYGVYCSRGQKTERHNRDEVLIPLPRICPHQLRPALETCYCQMAKTRWDPVSYHSQFTVKWRAQVITEDEGRCNQKIRGMLSFLEIYCTKLHVAPTLSQNAHPCFKPNYPIILTIF